MADRGIENIVSEFKEYLENVDRFYNKKLYVESFEKPEAKTVIPQELPVKEQKEITPVKAEQKVSDEAVVRKKATESDLFGNEVTVKEDWEFAETLEELNRLICNCQKCALGATRTKFVFGVGNPNADIVVIGEAPGADEDAKGEPFVGRAGQLLNKILEATGFKRQEVFICNILKCRPPGNRNPLPEEVEKCRPYLEKQLGLLRPKLILLLGRVAAESLLKTKEPLHKLRGKVHDYRGYKVMITFHPAALLRNPDWKRPTWDDMKQFKSLYEEIKNKK